MQVIYTDMLDELILILNEQGWNITRDEHKLTDSVLFEFPIVEVEPKYAHVIIDEDGNMKCSNCGSSNCFDNYCGHCGAKLIEERNNGVKE